MTDAHRYKPPLVRADALLHELQDIVRGWSRPTAWDVVGPLIQTELCERLDHVRQLLHALAELEALADAHAHGCAWDPHPPTRARPVKSQPGRPLSGLACVSCGKDRGAATAYCEDCEGKQPDGPA